MRAEMRGGEQGTAVTVSWMQGGAKESKILLFLKKKKQKDF
jgi:hypothetical protein